MTFASFEGSTEGGRPIELYRITLGPESFFYTSAEDDITVGATVYVAVPIKRERLSQGPEDQNRAVEIEVAGTNVFARRYVGGVPSQRAKVTIQRFHRTDTEIITLFEGFVRSVNFSANGKTAKMAVIPAVAALSRNIPRYTYQSSCNHVVYDSQCTVSDTNPLFRHTGLVTAVSGADVTVAGANGFADGWFESGFAGALGGLDARLILKHTGNVITLLLPFPVSPLGTNLILLAGCGHSIAICKVKFSNVLNYGGFAFVPTRNPFDSGIGPVKC